MNNANLPAMPSDFEYHDQQTGDRKHEMNSGLTKREHFAAMAMQGELASQSVETGEYHHDPCDESNFDLMAKRSLMAADALLAALEAG
jgi:hypothetical protein